MYKEFQILDQFIRQKGLRYTAQRKQILAIFLATEKHTSVQELWELVRNKYPEIGYTTVYRTMKLFLEAGLASQLEVGDGTARFEHKYNHPHHDHLVCLECGRCIEVIDKRIEQLQEQMALAHCFVPERHRLEIFGLCEKCVRKKREGHRK